MFKLTLLHISESKKSGLFSVTKDLGPVSSRVATGYLSLNNDELEVGDTVEIQATQCETVESTTEDGQVFKWLSFPDA